MAAQNEMRGDGRSVADAGPEGPPENNSDGLLASNDLVYILPPDLSVSVNQTHKNQYFQSNSYANTARGVCILNTGADYGDLRHSSLEFGITIPTLALHGAWFGRTGSILNVIKSITISSRSGDELSRIQDFNLLAYHQNPLRFDKQWVNTVGGTIGYGQYIQTTGVGNALFADQRFSIPLYLLSDFFGYGRLMPPMVLSGLRIEIEWATPNEAFLTCNLADRTALSGAGVVGYTIDNPFISMRSVQLTDATQRTLNELSATNGLELVYCDYERTDRALVAGEATLNMEIRKAASRALKAFVVTRERTVPQIAAPYSIDSFKSQPWGYSHWQWQLGSLYFPQQPIKSADTTNGMRIIAESYKQALIAHDKYKGNNGKSAALGLYKNGDGLSGNASRVTRGSNVETMLTAAVGDSPYAPYEMEVKEADGLDAGLRYHSLVNIGEVATATTEYGTFSNGNGCLAVTLERSDLFNLSGVPINNSRVLAIRADYTTGGAGGNVNAKTVTSFLKYVRLARVFLNNVEVEQ
jgi:hypothetical protein